MTRPTIIEGQLIVGDIEVRLPHRVKSATSVTGELLVAVVESPVGIVFDRNVYAIDNLGRVVWQIEKAPCFGGRKECPYIGVKLSEEGCLIAVTGVGAEFKVNLNTGQIELYDFNRF